MVKLQKYFLRLSYLLLFKLVGCKSPESINLNYLNNLNKSEKAELIKRIQNEVDLKIPFQGSLMHQAKCDTLIELRYNICSALQEKSTPFTKIGDYHIAFPLLEKAYKIDNKDALYYYSWLLLYYYRDYDRALSMLKEYDDLTPNQKSVAWGENVNFLKGLAYRQLNDYTNAINEFSIAINDDGEYVDIYAYLYRGICYELNGDAKNAIINFDYLIDKYSSCSAAYYWKAEVLMKLKDKSAAKKNYIKALQLVKDGYVKTDSYMDVFDIPNQEQIQDRINELF